MKHLFTLLFVMIFIMTSCEQAEVNLPDTSPKEAMQSFSSSKEFFDTFDKLSNLSYEEQKEWIKSNRIKNSLLTDIESCQDSVMLEMPRSFQILFNKDLEVEIENSIVYFKEGSMFIKSSSSTPILFSKLEFGKNAETRTEYSVPYNDYGVSFQKDIEMPSKYRFKYVHELRSIGFVITQPTTQYMSRLFLFIKLEYKGKKWHVAGEPRNIYINLGYSDPSNNYSNQLKRNLLNATLNQEILLYVKNIGIIPNNYVINIDGTIIHEVIGHPNTKKTNTWTAKRPPLQSLDPWD